MPVTKGRVSRKRSKAAICRKARLSRLNQLDLASPARSSSSSSLSELSNSIEELFINSLYLTTASSSSNNTLHNLCTSQQKIMAYERRKNNAVADSDEMDFYQVIHNSFLLELMRNTICIGCKEQWNGKMHIRIGRAGVAKIFRAMNIVPPVKEDHYEEIDRRLLLPCTKKFQHQSMQAAIYEAVDENDGDPTNLTVSGDGTWQRRGFKSIHGVAAVLSSNTTPKVLDVQRLSKKCVICTGALSVKNTDPDLYDEIINNHDCESNYDGSSGGMESQGIHDIFKRSIRQYQVQYTRYIGDGDSSVMWNLTQHPPYPGIEIEKIEDINHWSKKTLYRLEKLTQELKDTILDPEKKRKEIGGINRLTKGTKYDHQKHSLPKYVMEAIKPVSEDLASKETLQHVLNESNQNANESFHSFLWSMAPKNRYCSGTIIDSEMGHFSYVAFDRINKQRVKKEAQWRKRRGQQRAGDEDKNDDTIEDYHSGAY
ncbi:unnamed protein product [Rotaria sp. Silwood1]|nr:unnamed protein product [Rotaria sp. Silwood1]CAF1654338.1 unnamed protein product [Rotaria sp. Silwood1]CAF3757711.1 unnamed protein product [Rotaria sp. Silwood1]CAF4755213.1 unnamed protein product [Rotaria sp. Silwood1]